MPTLILDIETAGKLYEEFDSLTQNELVKKLADLDPESGEYVAKADEVKNSLGLSPLTGFVITLGMLDCDRDKAMVLYDAPGQSNPITTDGNITYAQKSEAEMLEIFWQKVKDYDEFVTFFGRGFDVPFLLLRSAILGIQPSKDIMSGRYLYQQKGAARHIDLFDQLTFYGSAVWPAKSLHMYCQAFDINTPKDFDFSGKGVSNAFRDGKYLDIAKYNAADLAATKSLFDYWNRHLRF